MDLYDYFHKRKKEEAGFCLDTFADMLGVSKCHLSIIINGRGAPSIILAFRIEEATQGEVTFMEMIKWVRKNKDRIMKKYLKKGTE